MSFVKREPTQAEKEFICLKLMEGVSLTKICKMKDMPAYQTVIRWLYDHEDFRKDYEFARNVQYEKMADDILDIVDNTDGDIDPETGKVSWENINRARLRADKRQWLLSHFLPKKFGNKVTTEVAGAVAVSAPPATPEQKFELARAIAFELAKATETK